MLKDSQNYCDMALFTRNWSLVIKPIKDRFWDAVKITNTVEETLQKIVDIEKKESGINLLKRLNKIIMRAVAIFLIIHKKQSTKNCTDMLEWLLGTTVSKTQLKDSMLAHLIPKKELDTDVANLIYELFTTNDPFVDEMVNIIYGFSIKQFNMNKSSHTPDKPKSDIQRNRTNNALRGLFNDNNDDLDFLKNPLLSRTKSFDQLKNDAKVPPKTEPVGFSNKNASPPVKTMVESCQNSKSNLTIPADKLDGVVCEILVKFFKVR